MILITSEMKMANKSPPNSHIKISDSKYSEYCKLPYSQAIAAFHSVLEDLDTPAFCLDTQYQYTCFNSHHAQVMHALYNADIKIGVSLFEYQYIEEDRQKARSNLDRALAGEHVVERAYSGDHIRSRQFFEISHSPIREQDGEIIGVSVIAKNVTDLVTAKCDLEKSDARLAGIISNSAAGIIYTDLDGHYLFTNEAFCDLTGYTKEELSHIRLGDLVHPDDGALERSLLDDIRNKIRTGFRMELRIRTKGGEECWGDLSVSAIFDDDKKPVNFIGVIKDITEKKRTESYLSSLNALKEELLISESLDQKLKKITDGIVEIFQADFARIWTVKRSDLCNSGCIHASKSSGPDACTNRQFCLHLNVSSGRYTHIDGDHRRVPMGLFKVGRVATGEEKMFITNDVIHDPQVSDHAWAESLGLTAFAGFRLLSQSLAPIGVLALFRKKPILPDEVKFLEDLAHTTSQILIAGEIDRTLRENEEFLSSIVENIPNMIFVKDAQNLRFIQLNKAGEDLLGYSRDELIGKNDYDFFPEKKAQFFTGSDRSVLSGHTVIDIPDEEILTRDKGKRILHTKKLPVLDQSGRPRFLLGISEDITEQKEIEAERDKLKTQLEYLLGATKTGIDIIDTDFNLIYVDPVWSSQYGDYKGKKCYDYFNDLESPCMGCGIPQAFETKKEVVTEEVLSKEGGRIVEVHTIPFQDAKGEWFVAEFNIDVTERKRVENQIDQYAKDLEFLSRRSVEMLDLDEDSDIFAFIGSTIKRLVPSGSVVIIGQVDNGDRSIMTRSIDGLEPMHLDLLGSLGPSIMGRSYPLSDESIEHMSTGGLSELPYGIRTISGNTFPEEIYQRIEESGVIGKIYGAGLSWKKNLQGSVVIILPPGVNLESKFRSEIFLQLSAIELIRRKITTELREERGLFIGGPIVVFKWGATEGWPVMYVSPNIHSQFGYLPEDFLHGVIPFASIVHPEDLKRVAGEVSRYSDEGRVTFEQEYRIKRSDGQFRWIYDFTVIERDNDGSVYAYHGYIQDIDDRKKTEHLLRESEENARALINAPKESIFIMKPDGTTLYLNETTASRLGRTVEDILGKSMFLMIPPEVAEQRKKHIEEMLRSGESSQFIDKRFGRVIENNLYPILGDNGEVSRIAVYGRDITEKQEMDRRIAESEERYRVLAESSGDVIFIKDPDGRFRYINRTGALMIGSSPEDIIGKCNADIFPLDIATKQEQMGLRVCTTKLPVSGEMQIPIQGNLRWFDIRLMPLLTDDQSVRGIMGSIRDISERKEMEEALKILARIADEAPASITVHEFDGTFLYCNEVTSRLHGYTYEEFLSLNLHDIDVPESEQLIESRMQDLREHGEIDFDVRHYRKDGSTFPLHINAKIIRWKGKIALLGIWTDLSEREKAQEMLQLSEEKYRTVVEQTYDGIVIIQGKKFVFANEAFTRMSGYPLDELEKREYPVLVREEALAEFHDFVVLTMASREVSTNCEANLVRHNTSIFPVEINAIGIEYQGVPSGLFVIRDISERRHAEEMKQKITNLLNETQQITKLGGWDYEVRTGDISWTDEVYHIHGVGYDYDPGNIQRDISFYTPEDALIIEQAFYRAVNEGVPYDHELKFIRADKRQIWVRTIGKPVIEEGKVVRVTGNIMDITERKQLEISLREALQKLKVLTGITRHDVVNDLTAITLSLEIIQDAADEDTKQKYLAKALAASKILEKTIGFTQEYEDFGSIAGKWYKLLEILTAAKSAVVLGDIIVELRLDPGMEIFSDPIIRKVFTTLLENSIRHGGDNLSDIRVFTYEEEGNLVIVYEDNGMGIPPFEKEWIFDHGYGKNTGIGLFLAREILSITGLSIKECGIEGKGARFEIFVPNGGFRFFS